MHSAEIEELFGALARDAGLRQSEPTSAAWAVVASFAGSGLSRSSILGAAYERALAPASRRAGGVHYTPDALVARVVAQAFDGLAPSRRASPFVLDPAMGGGAFLCAALREIVRQRGEAESPALRRELALAYLHGIDVDESAVLAARRALWLEVGDPTLPLDAFDRNLVCGDALLDAPFEARPWLDWKRTFHRVFARSEGGFDLVLGNPPFLGGKRIRTVHGDRYASQLGALHPGANKNVDLAAHFLRRGFDALAKGGVLGLITTNTIAQGDTRAGGLAHVLRSGGSLLAAERSVPWPGAAGVVVSLVWLTKGPSPARARLDGELVDHIDAFLSPLSAHEDPKKLPEMKRRAFIGCFLRGSGFVLDDERARALLAHTPEGGDILRPFMGGEEVLKDPLQRPHRWVVHFGARTLEEARAYPALLELVRERVRPFREARQATKADAAHRASWWRFANPRPELHAATRGLSHVVVIPRMSSDVVAARIPNKTVLSDQLVVVASSSFAVFALLSSRAHEAWARFTCSTLGRGLRYTPSDALETFPIPAPCFESLERDGALTALGQRFDETRAAALQSRGIGLSKLRRLLEAPRASDPDLDALRTAKAALDRAVFEAYGWPASAAQEDDVSLVRRLLDENRARR